MDESELEQLRQQAQAAFKQGNFSKAVQVQQQIVDATGKQNLHDMHGLGFYYFMQRAYPEAAEIFRYIHAQDPNYQLIDKNLGISLLRIGEAEQAIPYCLKALEKAPEDLVTLSVLADAYGKIEDRENTRKYGERALTLRDQQARENATVYPLPDSPPKPFDGTQPERNIIAFTLFGKYPLYHIGAIQNADMAPVIYPGWRCRFYCSESVPKEVTEQLAYRGAEIITMPKAERPTDALFWRFLVMNDKNIDRFLIRDCDACVNVRERVAVDEWLQSDKYFHLMRDYPSHSDLMLAGLWGGVAGILPELTELLKGFSYNPYQGVRSADQLFLGDHIWPTISQSCMSHDSNFRVFGARDFPAAGVLQSGRHVGDNDVIARKLELDKQTTPASKE
ncbi:MAG: hypothetical protein CMF50_01390 [Legionellales bacterium]|nr:hypothetical protein [Legionellales bacterium]|tara:strand:+ start:37011 stop:38186 length:1176 start_codon:yes stop_codon:yes gene_type:complete